METKVIQIAGGLASPAECEKIEQAAAVLRAGGLCALPTETVYGLAANGLDDRAVRRIFAAKGRPADNPLILHISAQDELAPLVSAVPPGARALIDAFWPGPLTLVLKKSGAVPEAVSGGLKTVAVRLPGNEIMRAVIRRCGFPLAAPSANRSGLPSPTLAAHVLHDLGGKIEMIVDGGPCSVGVESTVLDLSGETPRILRPGFVTAGMLREIVPEIEIDRAVCHGLDENARPASPGMKYKHYAPRARLTLLREKRGRFVDYLNALDEPGVFALCYQEDIGALKGPYISLGRADDSAAHARALYAALRKLDEMGACAAYAREPAQTGAELAFYNRLLRAAAFRVVEI